MNLRQRLVIITIMSIFITGCSSNNRVEKNSTQEEAIYQKTMTKVQNDVNEILNKEYQYVLDNMGVPYCTTYYIDLDHIKNTEILSLDDKINKMRLIYPKYTSDNVLEGSALFIEFKDNKVIEVQNNEISDYNIKTEKIGCSNEIILNKYNEEINLQLSKIESINLDNYIGKDENELKNITGEIDSNFELYSQDKDLKVEIYLLNETSHENSKMLMVYEKSNKIENINIVKNTTTINLLKDYLKNN